MERHTLPEPVTPARTAYHRTHAPFMIYAYASLVTAVSVVAYIWHGIS